MKYFFLAEGWAVGRAWELGRLWDEAVWRRSPHIQRLDLGILEEEEVFWLYEVEEAVLMVEVKSLHSSPESSSIGQVLIKRLINAEQVIDLLTKAPKIFK